VNVLLDYVIALAKLPWKQWLYFLATVIVTLITAWKTAGIGPLPQIVVTLGLAATWLLQQPWAHPAVAAVVKARAAARALKSGEVK
jgi:hypothetical protein